MKFLLLFYNFISLIMLINSIKLRGDKPVYKQANIPSTIAIAMDIPAYGLS